MCSALTCKKEPQKPAIVEKAIFSSTLDQMFIGQTSMYFHNILVKFALVVGFLVSFSIILLVVRSQGFLGLPPALVVLLKSLVIFTVVVDSLNFLGHLLLRHRIVRDSGSVIEKGTLVVQFVSRGENIDVLRESARTAYEILAEEARIPFKIRVVTECQVESLFIKEERSRYDFVHVPKDYKTSKGSLYKARVLEYARAVRDSDDVNSQATWILFMDEESILTRSAARGIFDYIRKDIDQNTIAQGLITYTGRGIGRSAVSNATEIKRVGYNLGRYYFQNAVLRDIYLGFQGSFFCASRRVVSQVTFDFGPEASITEDIFFAFTAARKGFKCVWLEGYIREQATESVIDFLRQRRRWMKGLMHFLASSEIPLIRRIILFLAVTLPGRLWVWGVIPFLVLLNSYWGGQEPLCLTCAFQFGMPEFRVQPALEFIVILYILLLFQSSFSIGLIYSFQDLDLRSLKDRILYAVGCCLALPIAIFLEQFASLYSLFAREEGFAVVKKSIDITDTDLERSCEPLKG